MDIGSNGKSKVVKHGTKEVTSEGFEYELTVNFELINDQHLVSVSKDRTNLFSNSPEFVITSKTGEKLLKWCNAEPVAVKDIVERINNALSVSELTKLYNDNPSFQQGLQAQFRSKKEQLEKLSNPQNFSQNGTHSHKQ